MTILLIVLIAAVVAKDTEYWTSENEPSLDLLMMQVMSQQLYTTERTRSEGHSGIKQVSIV